MRKVPAYIEIHNQIKKKIQDGTYPVSQLLPTEPELEKIYQVSRTTIRSAMDLLKEEGYVEIKQGRGTMVLDHRTIQDLNKVTSVTESLRRRGFVVRTKSMYIDLVPADEILGNELNMTAGDSVTRIQRIQLINDKPIAIMKNYLPTSMIPDLIQYTNQFSGLYQFLEEQYQLEISSASDKIFARSADFFESEMLAVQPGTALLCIRRICYQDKHPFCVDDVSIIGDQYELAISTNGRYK
ncbi:GntR family transcriptional regulator [Clostridium sp. E02]|uniref:GntR family transcriptional regulator n=1 Tax=Clostridium sp. E02 TaxID=2487134 RepID=UPI000F533198|nr:GntR family transcriptional regulator [Clostridium sp. E02]